MRSESAPIDEKGMLLCDAVRPYRIIRKQPNSLERLMGRKYVTRVEMYNETMAEDFLIYFKLQELKCTENLPAETISMLSAIKPTNKLFYEITGEKEGETFVNWLVENNLGHYPIPESFDKAIEKAIKMRQ